MQDDKWTSLSRIVAMYLVATLERSTDLQQAQQTQDAHLVDLQRRMLLVLERLADQVTPILQGIAAVQAVLCDDYIVKSA